MWRYIIKRILYSIVVFLLVSIVMFSIYKLIPGDPVRLMMDSNKGNDPAQYAIRYNQMREKLGLDKPMPVQYFAWLTNMFKGDFGWSIKFMAPVINVVPSRLFNTLVLNILQLLLVFGIAFPLGIRTAVKRNGPLDRGVQAFTIVGYSLPSFVVCIVFIFIFSVQLGLLPISGMNSPGVNADSPGFIWDRLWHMILPLLVMTVTNVGSITRYVRAAMIDALSMDCIRTARAKGLREKVVIYSHAFRNALLPVITIVTFWFVGIFGGSIIIESYFLYDGMGKIMIDALRNLDYSIVMTVQMFYVTLSLLGNLLMDLAYCVVDPRVKLS